MPSHIILEKEYALKLTPNECFAKVGKPYSKKLEENIMLNVVLQGYRMLSVSYCNPLLKRHTAMAQIKYLNNNVEVKTAIILD
jgi:hypothetical protein